MRLWWLVVAQYSYLPIPRRWQAAAAELPRALGLLPLWGLAGGLLLLLLARVTWVLGARWTAGLLLGVHLLLNGGLWLRDIMLLADGRRLLPQAVQVAATPEPLDQSWPTYPLRPAAWIVGGAYLVLVYYLLYLLLAWRLSLLVLPAAAVVGRWLYLWGVYDFAALPPASLKLGFSPAAYRAASLSALLLYGFCAIRLAVLWPALVVALLAGLLLYRSRSRALGALDQVCYGAAAAWAELLLLWAYFGFSMLMQIM